MYSAYNRRDSTSSSLYASYVLRQGTRVRVVFRSHVCLVRRVIEIPTSPEYDTDDEITNLLAIVFEKNKRLPRTIRVKRKHRRTFILEIPREMRQNEGSVIEPHRLSNRERRGISASWTFLFSRRGWRRLFAFAALVFILGTFLCFVVAIAL